MHENREPTRDEADVDEIIRELREGLGPFDPAHGDPRIPTPQMQDRRIEAILAAYRASGTPTPPPRRLVTRRRFFSLAGGVTAAAVGGAVWAVAERSQPRSAFAATPDPLRIAASGDAASGPQRLRNLAARAERGQPSPQVLARRPVEHLVIRRWDLNGQVAGRVVTSAVLASQRQLWRTPANQAVAIDSYPPPEFPSTADRAAWRAEGSPGDDEPDRRTEYGPGSFVAAWKKRPPLETRALQAWLRKQDTSDAAIITAVADLLRERVLTSPERAAVLRVLAQEPGIEFAGTTTDRANRLGDVYSTTSTSAGGSVIYLYVVEPGTGAFLAHERILTAGVAALTVRRPAVIRYDTYLTAEFVAAMP